MPAGTSWRTRAWTLAGYSTISATRTSSTLSDTPSFRRTGSATSGEISRGCAAADATPGGGEFWILKIAHDPSPKNVSENGFWHRRGVAFLWKAFLQKKISGV